MVNIPLIRFQPNRETLTQLWNTAVKIPGGRRLFSRLVGRAAPYTGTIGAQVDHLESGYARCRLRDHRRIRNHLQSIHAIALANFIEETTGLAMVSAVPEGMRGIVTKIEIEYLKKARGELEAECRSPIVVLDQTQDYIVKTEVKNIDGDVVATGMVYWRIGPRTQ